MPPGSEPQVRGRLPTWLLWLHVACAAAAGAAWYLDWPGGGWPLLLLAAPWTVQWIVSGRRADAVRPYSGGRTGFELPLLLFLLSAGVGVWAAFDSAQAWAKFWRIVGGAGLFYALENAAPLGRKRAWLLAAFGAGVAVYFLATHDWEAYPAKLAVLTDLGRALQAPLPPLAAHRLHPNVAGGILAMMAPFGGLVAAWSLRRLRDGTDAHKGLYYGAGRGRWAAGAHGRAPLRAAAALGCTALIAFGLLMSTSRGAWIALGCALLLWGLVNLVRWATRSRPALGAWLLPFLVVILLLAALGAVAVRPGGLLAVLKALPGPETGVSRVELLRNSLSLVRDHPLIGAGLGSFQMLYSTYVLFLHVGYTVHSHNLLVNVAVEQGLVGVAALLWMWALLGARLRSRLWLGGGACRARLDDDTAALVTAVLCLVVVLVHGLVDDVLYGSRAVLLLFLPLAFGGRPAAPAAVRVGRRELLVPAGLVVVLVAAMAWRKPLLSVALSNLGAVHQSRAELAVYSWPEWPLQDEVRRTIDLSRPVGEFEQALALNPRNPTAHRRLGMIDLSTGRYEEALAHLEAAYAVEAHSEVTRSLLGEAYLANGRQAEGRALWAAVNDAGGRLAARVFWYGYIGDKERQEWMRQAAEGR